MTFRCRWREKQSKLPRRASPNHEQAHQPLILPFFDHQTEILECGTKIGRTRGADAECPQREGSNERLSFAGRENDEALAR